VEQMAKRLGYSKVVWDALPDGMGPTLPSP
jgi:hypothetical protein